MIRPALLLLLALSLAPALAAGFDLPALMENLAQAPTGRMAYREEKSSGLLAQPIVLEGVLEFRRPDYLRKEVASPYESYEIRGDEVIIDRALQERPQDPEGSRRRLSLADYPPLQAFVASLRATLNGDRATLERYYRLELTGQRDDWRLTLIPTDPEMADRVEQILIRGRGGQLTSVETLETGGDRSLLQLEQPAP